MVLSRQQKRQKERIAKKKLEKKTNELEKTARTPEELEKINMAKWVMGLSETESLYIQTLVMEQSRMDIRNLDRAYERVLDVYLDEHNLPYEDLEDIRDKIRIEGELTRNYFEKGENYVMKIESLKPQIIKTYEDMKAEGKKEKEIINELIVKFSQISTNAVKRVVNEYKRSKRSETIIEEGLAAIFPEASEEEVKEVIKKEEPKKVATVKEDVELNKNEIVFEELSKKIIADVKGSCGTYHIENGEAVIDGFKFMADEDVDEEISLRRRVLERELSNLEFREKEYKAIIKQYLN